MRPMAKRLEWLDCLKAFAIFLVTLGHVFGGLGLSGSTPRNVIYAFHMPLFFGISGYLAAHALVNKNGTVAMSSGEACRFALRKAHSLLLPYVLAPLLLWPLFYGYISRDGYFAEAARHMFIENTSLWFLPCLFLLMNVFAVVALTRNVLARLPLWLLFGGSQLALAVLLVLTHNPFLRSASSYMLPFAIGAYIAYDTKLIEICRKPVVLSFAAIVFVLSCAGFVHLAGDQGVPLCKACRMIAGVSSIPLFMVAFMAMKTGDFSSYVLAPVGRATLAIYMFQDTPVSCAGLKSMSGGEGGLVCRRFCCGDCDSRARCGY